MKLQKFFLSLVFVGLTSFSFGQKPTKNFLFPSKIGVHYNYGNEKNFLFDDADYFYKTNTIKLQFFYPLIEWKKIEISLVVQPQMQLIKHQLLNEQYVLPSEENYLDKRARFTKLKTISLIATEFSFHLEKKLYKSISAFLELGLGIGYIDTETERLAKGFTFIENGNLGFTIRTSSVTTIQIHTGLGHVSNFNFQQPNSGYNLFNTGIGFQYLLN